MKSSLSFLIRNISFYVSLTVHLSMTLDNDQINVQMFNKFIKILYLYIIRAQPVHRTITYRE
jgi:hypothetical protein